MDEDIHIVIFMIRLTRKLGDFEIIKSDPIFGIIFP